ncbi:MAG: bifunctional folylpolyglutamate synthase/dihydrofolate synthase [Lachnospiraceae bacterium]|nr:bifunctional folylpolyglutamate synthase/dihydrofolate synthase [Lachnospiraceae bacterium]
MNCKESLDYISSVSIYGSVLGLDSIKELLKRLDNPQNKLKAVHIAGTNGKGSTIAFIESALKNAGYKVGKYSSPAVYEYFEIITINGDNITGDDYAKCMTLVKACCDAMVKEGLAHPTPFEIETALAFLYFSINKCDMVLVETGMGGETDATNVFDKVLCSIITPISLDHMQFLGDSIEKIAQVKAGIIVKNCPVVVADQTKEAIDVIKKVAADKKSPVIVTDEITNIEEKDGRLHFTYKEYSDLVPFMPGVYQSINAAVAIEVLRILEECGFRVLSEDNIKKALEQASLCGRFEKISDSPVMILDGAHNPGAAAQLQKTVGLYFTNKKLAFIMGVLADKDYDKVARIMAPLADFIVTITPNNKRALDADSLKETVSKYNANVVSSDSLENAYNILLEKYNLGEIDAILAFGSLSYLGELKRLVRREVDN